MKEKVKFYLNKSNAVNISKELNKFALELSFVSYNSYSFEKIQTILKELQKNGFQIEIEFPNNVAKITNKDYQNNKCGDCEYFEPGEGCFNTVSQVRTKHLKTEKSKGCYWGKWN